MEPIPCDEHDRIVLAKTVYGEARGEPREGQIAVTWVIINRYLADWGCTIAAICHAPWQFECWNGTDDIFIFEYGVYAKIRSLVNKILNKRFPKDPTGGCVYFNNPAKETPDWINNVDREVVIGSHHFYRRRR